MQLSKPVSAGFFGCSGKIRGAVCTGDSRDFFWPRLELCLSIAGRACIILGDQIVELRSSTYCYHWNGERAPAAFRGRSERHQFMSLGFSPAFLAHLSSGQTESLCPLVKAVIGREEAASQVSAAYRLDASSQHFTQSLRCPPVARPARPVWFRGKVLELLAPLFFRSTDEEESSTRGRRIIRE